MASDKAINIMQYFPDCERLKKRKEIRHIKDFNLFIHRNNSIQIQPH